MNPTFQFDMMEGQDFEKLCADVLKRNGFYGVCVTKGSGDYGVDIIAKYNNLTYAIQCKRYNSNVGIRAVQEVSAGKTYYHCDNAAVMTNSYFTDQAKDLAGRTGVALWDRYSLIVMMKKAYPDNNIPLPRSSKRQKRSHNKKAPSGSGCLTKLLLGFILLIAFLLFLRFANG